MENVSFKNFGVAFIIGAKGGTARHATVKRGALRYECSVAEKAAEYETGAARTPVTLSYAASLLHAYTTAFEEGKKPLHDKVLMVLPDDSAIRSFEIRKLFIELEDLDEAISRATKPWMGEEWQEAIAAFCTAYADALGAGLSLGTMKYTNVYSWEIRLQAGAEPLESGATITLESGKTADGKYLCESSALSGTFPVSVRRGRVLDGGGVIPDRYYVPRSDYPTSIKALRKAAAALRDHLPKQEVAETVTVGEAF